MRLTRIDVLCVLTFSVLASPGIGAVTETSTLLSASGPTFDRFGDSIATDDTTVVVGAPGAESPDGMTGVVHVYDLDGDLRLWERTGLLAGAGTAPGDGLGAAVALDGDTLVAGAPGADGVFPDSGAVHIWRRMGDSWIEDDRLTPPAEQLGLAFGTTVSVSGDRLVIGAPGFDGPGKDSGVVYAYRHDGAAWMLESLIESPEAAAGDMFGSVVSLSGEAFVAGAPGSDTAATDGGRGYVFRHDGTSFALEATLSPVTLSAGDGLGYAASMDGEVLAIGAPFDDIPAPDSGAAYAYRFDGTNWNLEARMSQPHPVAGDHFGCALSVRGDVAMVGADGRDFERADSGGAFICRFNGSEWFQDFDLGPSDHDVADHAGSAVAAGDVFGFVGAPSDNDGGEDAGSVFVWQITATQRWAEHSKLTATTDGVGEEFGQSVDIDGDVAIVGANGDRDMGMDAGAAFIWERSGDIWVERQKIHAWAGAPGDHVGLRVGIDGEFAIVSAHYDDEAFLDAGAAYVFYRQGDSWVPFQKLIASDAQKRDSFGVSVAIDGDVIVVGAEREDDGGTSAGAVYVFRLEGTEWVEEAKLLASNPQPRAELGRAVGVSGDVIVAGAHLEDHETAGVDAGVVYVWRYDGTAWVPEARLTSDDGESDDRFGRRLSISGDAFAVGTHRDDDAGNQSGSAYVIRWDGISWAQEAKLTPADHESNDFFGFDVSIDADTVLVGSRYDDEEPAGFNSGSAYVFTFDGASWIERAKLIASDGAWRDHFGGSVCVADGGSRVFVTAPTEDAGGFAAGAVYSYDLPAAGWVDTTEQQKLTAGDAASDSQYGQVIATTGEVLVVGAPRLDRHGAVVVFERYGSEWREAGRLSPHGAVRYGTAVDVDATRLVVGDPAANAAWVHDRAGGDWTASRAWTSPGRPPSHARAVPSRLPTISSQSVPCVTPGEERWPSSATTTAGQLMG